MAALSPIYLNVLHSCLHQQHSKFFLKRGVLLPEIYACISTTTKAPLSYQQKAGKLTSECSEDLFK